MQTRPMMFHGYDLDSRAPLNWQERGLNSELADLVCDFCLQHEIALKGFWIATVVAFLSRFTRYRSLTIGVAWEQLHDTTSYTADTGVAADLIFTAEVSDTESTAHLLHKTGKFLDSTLRIQTVGSEELGDRCRLHRFTWLGEVTKSDSETIADSRVRAAERDPLICIDVLELSSSSFAIRLGLRTRQVIEQFDSALLQLERLVLTMLRSPTKRISAIPFTNDQVVPPYWQALDNRSGAEVEFDTDMHFVTRFQHWVDETPAAEAARDAERSLTYAELDLRSRCLVHQLQIRGIGQGDCVLVCLERTIDLVPTVVALFQLGALYVPIDPNSPAQRTEDICATCNPKLALVHQSTEAKLNDNSETLVLTDALFHKGKDHAPLASPVYWGVSSIIYTSGSTGLPKGVAIRHVGLSNHLLSMSELLSFDQESSMVAVTNAAFDASIMELCLPLWNGACVEIVGEALRRDPIALAELLAGKPAPTMFATPATWEMLIAQDWQGHPGLQVICGGESLTRNLADALLDRSQEVWNIYGPTECTVCATVEKVPRGNATVSIGRPVKNTLLRILNNDLNLVPVGVPGVLYVGGAGVADGYYSQPELTRQRFIEDPIGSGERLYCTGDVVYLGRDQKLYYVGREDSQIKMRGYRIEPGEIETAILEHGSVNAATVVMSGEALADRHLRAYVVPLENFVLPELLAHLRRKLPQYMVPSRVIKLAQFPLTSNGKVDRLCLAEMTVLDSLGEEDRPRSDLESRVAAIWRKLLGREIGRTTSFFEFGNSIQAVKFIASLESELAIQLDFGALYEHSTICDLVSYLNDEHQSETSSSTVLLNTNAGDQRPLFCIDGVHLYHALAKQLENDLPVYGVYVPDTDRTGHGTVSLSSTEELSTKYIDAIRMKQTEGPYRLAGFSYGGVIAYEIATQLKQLGQEVEVLILLDSLLVRTTSRAKGWFSALRHRIRSTSQRLLLRFHHEKAWEWQRLLATDRYESISIKTYDDRVLLCRAAEEDMSDTTADPTLGWGSYIARLTVTNLPGDHRAMVSEHNSARLAGVIRDHIADASDIGQQSSIQQL